MTWIVLLADEFVREFQALDRSVRVELAATASVLEQFGPQLGRPRVDTLKGSRHSNMKELRVNAGGGVWRVAFAFGPGRRAVLLAAGNKAGTGERRFYRALILRADSRFDRHLAAMRTERGEVS